MRRIDKSTILSTDYKKWEEQLEATSTDHPKYRSDHKYYLDVVMNLFYCQKGLCAYTEQLLCNEALYQPEMWKNGRFKLDKKETFGQLDHFDAALKKTKGWLWENLFMIHSDINNLKSNKAVSDLLKPDSLDYHPFELLAYDIKKHIFIANPNNENLSEADRKTVNDMLCNVLYINHATVIRKREDCLNQLLKEYELFGSVETPPSEFLTAWEMSLSEMSI